MESMLPPSGHNTQGLGEGTAGEDVAKDSLPSGSPPETSQAKSRLNNGLNT